jgi:serine/threonine protein kinase
MPDSTGCVAVEELIRVLEDEVDPKSSEIRHHIVNCDACAQATLNFVSDATLVAVMRKAFSVEGSSGCPASMMVERRGELISTADEESIVASRIKSLIKKLHELPKRVAVDAQNATIMALDTQAEIKPDIDWSTSFAAAESENEIGRLNGFRILKLLGYGGMGGVFLAEDIKLSRRVALKLIRPEFALQAGVADRFLREAKAVAAIHNQHIVTIFQVGQERGISFLAMELLQGETLDASLKREGQVSAAHVLSIGRQIAMGLAAAHDSGLIHRDIKPANVWLERGPLHEGDSNSFANVKLLDFGLARPLNDDEHMTQSGMIIGTPSYMAPEQADGDDVDARTDLFSLGVVLYRMTTGRLPFPGTKPMEILKSLATVTPTSPKMLNPNLPLKLSDLIDQLLAKDRNARPATARDVANRLALIESPFHSERQVAPGATVPIERRSRIGRRLVLGSIAAMIMMAGVWIIVKDRKGDVVAKFRVPDEGSYSVETDLASPKGITPSSIEKNEIGKLSNKQIEQSTLDRLDPKRIPVTERFDWQPDELVAVIGTHHLRSWFAMQPVTFHPSGEFFVGSTWNGIHQAWSTQTLQLLNFGVGEGLPPGGWGSDQLCFSSDGSWLFGGISGKYRVDRSQPNRPTFKLASTRSVNKVTNLPRIAISPDGRWLLLSGLPQGTLEVWDTANDEIRFVKEIPIGDEFLGISQDGCRLAYADHPAGLSTEVIQLWGIDWTAAGGPTLTKFATPIPGTFAVLSPDGKKLINWKRGSQNVQLIDVSGELPRVESEFTGTYDFQFSPDGNWLANVESGNIVARQRTDSGWEPRFQIPILSGANGKFRYSPDGKTLVVSESQLGMLRVWDLTVNPPMERSPSITLQSSGAFSPDGRLLGVGGPVTAAVWKMDGDAPQLTTSWHGNSERPPSFSPDSNLLALATEAGGGNSRIWNLSNKAAYPILDGVPGIVQFAKEGQTIYTLSLTNQLLTSQPWEITLRGAFHMGAQTPITNFPSGISPLRSLNCLRPEVNRFVKVTSSSTLQVYDFRGDEKPLFELAFPGKGISDFKLSADGQLLATSMYGGKCVVWDLSESPTREYVLPESVYRSLMFSSDNRLLFAATDAGISIFDWAVGRLVRQIKFPGTVSELIPHPDGHHIATVNGNGTIYILRIPELTGNKK